MDFRGKELPPSVMSVPILAFRTSLEAGEEPIWLDQATGFLLRSAGSLFLVTNWHVVTGRDPVTGESLGKYSSLREYLEVSFPLYLGGDLYWELRRIDLFDESSGRARWLVHPWAPPKVGGTDVVLIPMSTPPTSILAYDLEDAIEPKSLSPGSELSVVGYPFGVASGGATWTRATVASEPSHGFKDDPIYLVDARSRSGQSGSPVVARRSTSGEDGRTEAQGNWALAGVYSGRVNAESDLGRVWFPVVLSEILRHQETDALTYE